MRHGVWAVALAATVAFGLACSGGATSTKLSKPLSSTQAKTAGQVGAAKKKNGTPSADGSKKLQVERKKQKSESGAIVWVIVEEWVLVDDWHDEIWVVDDFVDSDDVFVVSLDDFGDDLGLIDQVDDLSLDDYDEIVVDNGPADDGDEEVGGD